MGLLDDAIREHLELKRKHGAAEDDVRRQETEALGPARRDFAAPAEPAEQAEAGAPPAAEAEAPPVVQAEPAASDPADWLEDDEPVEPPPREPIEHAAEPADPGLAQEPLPAPDPLPAGDTPPQGFPAVSRDEEEEDGEDVLEETPDFLQDTPEHDRLWFEQKPPRDFDFDG